MKDYFLPKLYWVMFLLAFLWVLLGSPIMGGEWQDVPHRLRLMLTLLPGRMHSAFALWR